MPGKATSKLKGTSLSWSHCIPTVDRIDILRVAIACSLAQTRLPREIIVIDASENWLAHQNGPLSSFSTCGGPDTKFKVSKLIGPSGQGGSE